MLKRSSIKPSSPNCNQYHDLYSVISRIYYFLESIYSGGKIRACKLSQVSEIKSGNKVLYAGVGAGYEAVKAAQIGAQITGIDLSLSMLNKAQENFSRVGLSAEFLFQDILEENRFDYFDIVIANFFLNVFSEEKMKSVLSHLVKLTRGNGKVIIADFSPVKCKGILGLLQNLYWYLPLYSFKLSVQNSLHPIYDYTSYFADLGLQLEKTLYFELFKSGPRWYWTITASKVKS